METTPKVDDIEIKSGSGEMGSIGSILNDDPNSDGIIEANEPVMEKKKLFFLQLSSLKRMVCKSKIQIFCRWYNEDGCAVQSGFYLLLVPIDNGAGTLAWKVFGNFLLQLVKAGKTNNKVSTTINP